jgi:hypothetical protein
MNTLAFSPATVARAAPARRAASGAAVAPARAPLAVARAADSLRASAAQSFVGAAPVSRGVRAAARRAAPRAAVTTTAAFKVRTSPEGR